MAGVRSARRAAGDVRPPTRSALFDLFGAFVFSNLEGRLGPGLPPFVVGLILELLGGLPRLRSPVGLPLRLGLQAAQLVSLLCAEARSVALLDQLLVSVLAHLSPPLTRNA